jgi:LysM repeat protein
MPAPMNKSSASSTTAPRLCPTCGTRVGAAATKCLVCGADLTAKAPVSTRGGSKPGTLGAPRTRGPLPIILLVLVILGLAGGGAYYFYTQLNHGGGGPLAVANNVTGTPTATNSPPPSFTWTPTATETPVPSDTPQPPLSYKVVTGDTCVAIAAAHNVSSQSIILLNNLDPNCNLSVGRTLLIPLPTPTPSPLPSATLGAAVATQVPRTTYTVHSGDTLAGIAKFYGVTVADLMDVNGLTDPGSITAGQVLIIPLERVITPGPSPTATLPPPWPAPNQLVPADGQSFNASDVVTLQWTAVGTLRADEFYIVNVEDVTCNCARTYRQATTETKLIVPATFRHTDATLHVYRWTVTTGHLRAGDTALPQYDSAGASSPIRDFIWMGGAAPAATATP